MNEEVMKQLKQQTFWARVTACCMAGILLVVLVSALVLVPKVNFMLTEVEITLNDINVAVAELDKTATDLSKIDFPKLGEDTQKLVTDSSDAIAEAVEKIEAIDINSLNTAIEDFGSVVAPIAKFFGKK